MSFSVKVYCRKFTFTEKIFGAGDFQTACAIIQKDGLFTSNKNGPVWFPPWEIEAVVLDDNLGGFD
jgi:hypothetical protein